MALIFKSAFDDSAFQRALKGMEISAGVAAMKIKQKFSDASDDMERRFGQLASALPGGGILSSLGLGGAAAGAAGAVLGGIAKQGDEAANAIARISAATGNLEEANKVYMTLRDLSEETGVAVSESAAMFTRYSIAARQIGATNEQVETLISTVQKAGIVGGSSVQEITAASTQLGQALASGRFQGDELRSVMENMPLLAEQLAKQLGVSVGELRAMGTAGELTAENVFPALLKAGEEISRKFAEMPQTMSRSWATFAQSGKAAIADIDKAAGVSKFFTALLEGWQGIESDNVSNGYKGGRKQIAEANKLRLNAEAEMQQLRDRKTKAVDAIGMRQDISLGRDEDLNRIKDLRGDIEVGNREYMEKEDAKREAAKRSEIKKTSDEERKLDFALADKKKSDLKKQIDDGFKLWKEDDDRKRKIKKEGMNEELSIQREGNAALTQDLGDAWQDMHDFNRASPDERRQMNRNDRDEDRAKSRERRMRENPNARDARSGAGRRLAALADAQKAVELSDASITKLVNEIDKLILQP